MKSPNFIDYVKIFCGSGKGGKGSTHLHRDKFTIKGGPDGGDGGDGGSVIMRGNKQLWTLLHLKYKRHVFAEDGGDGSKARKTGKNGKHQIIDVPLGTIANDAETGQMIGEIKENGQILTLLKGGKGGLGNWHFKSSVRQTPRYAQKGQPRIEKKIILELKVLADVGLVGFPNAGKSTLLSVVSEAKPKIDNYPFTTLVPNLGMVSHRDNQSFVMADIPGLIQGAHTGKGLGIRFLRHIERNAILLFMISCESKNILEDYKILLNELEKYNPELLDKTRLLAITKCDLLDKELLEELKPELPQVPTVFISSVSGFGLMKLKDLIWNKFSSKMN